MELLGYMAVITLVLIFVIPKLQAYMRMLVVEADEMEKFYNA